jgi:hypothetical protein
MWKTRLTVETVKSTDRRADSSGADDDGPK